MKKRNIGNWWSLSTLLLAWIFCSGCATDFPRPQATEPSFTSAETAAELFESCLAAHGGDLKQSVNDVNIAISGEWGALIKKIQPLVTDFNYRIASEERYLLSESASAVRWRGPAGVKFIFRTPTTIDVFYNGAASTDADVLASSSMTADAFALFHLGPSVLKWSGAQPQRLSDVKELGRNYHRLYFELQPGFGSSERDEVVLYVDAATKRMHRVWITLEGFKTTQGATVDVTCLDYIQVDGYVFPAKLIERVRAPIRAHAHAWEVVGIDLDRGLQIEEVNTPDWSPRAALPAARDR